MFSALIIHKQDCEKNSKLISGLGGNEATGGEFPKYTHTTQESTQLQLGVRGQYLVMDYDPKDTRVQLTEASGAKANKSKEPSKKLRSPFPLPGRTTHPPVPSRSQN